jgi:uncharacterized membrane protein YkoI
MKKVLLLLVAVSTPTLAVADSHGGQMETCLQAAIAKFPGEVRTMEVEIEDGRRIYEFDIVGKDGVEHEVECDAMTGKLTEHENEVADAEAPAFKDKAKISLEEAKKLALAKRAGEIIEIEYEVEADGTPSYEFDIRDANGKEWEVEVDAVTGKVLEEEEELYQVGTEG